MADTPSRPDADDPVPDPHRDKPVPPAQEGMRPGADEIVRPEQDEPLGPLAGLMGAAGAEVADEAADVAGTDDSGANDLLASMGVEDEGIEGGQLLGLVAATLIVVAVLAVTLIFAFIMPYQASVGVQAQSNTVNDELQILSTQALAKLNDFGRTDSTYHVPIGQAMGLVVARYASDSASAAGLPASAQAWNLLPVYQAGPGRAVQQVDAEPFVITPRDSAQAPVAVPVGGEEEVGEDVEVPEVQVIDDDTAEE